MTTATTDLLDDLTGLRRRVRADRHGYWLPLLVMGVLVALAPLVYRPSPLSAEPPGWSGPTPEPGGWTAVIGRFGPLDPWSAGNPLAVSLYWLGAVLAGVVVAAAWYRHRGNRTGLRPRTGLYPPGVLIALVCYQIPWPRTSLLWVRTPALAIGAVVLVLGLAVCARCGYRRADGPALGRGRTIGTVAGGVLALLAAGFVVEQSNLLGFGALLIIAVGVASLAWAERSALCGVVAALFLVTALGVNLIDLSVGDPGPAGSAYRVAVNLALPAVVLLLGGLAGLIAHRRTR